jgi:cytochrome b subunit of formate dehydrogenase
LWVTYFIFQPFKITQIVIPLFIYAIVISYLAVKYRLYRDYITSKKDADARAAQ